MTFEKMIVITTIPIMILLVYMIFKVWKNIRNTGKLNDTRDNKND